MGLLENTIGAMLGGSHSDRPSEGGSPYAPLATALIGMLAAKAATGGFGDLGGLFGGRQAAPQTAPQDTRSEDTRSEDTRSEPQSGPGGLLGGLGGLLQQFQQNGQGQVAQSWVGGGPNQAASPDQITQALGPDTIRELAQKMGLSEEDVAARLSHELPTVVDKLTPDGRVPTHEESQRWL